MEGLNRLEKYIKEFKGLQSFAAAIQICLNLILPQLRMISAEFL
jgi:hypothetical protein